MSYDRVPAVATATVYRLPVEAETDEALIGLWLHGRPGSTVRAYEGDVARFRAAVGKPLGDVRLSDLQDFVDTIATLAPASQARVVSAVKALFSFAERIGYLQLNIGAALRVPSVASRLSDRILTETEVYALVAAARPPRDRAVVTLLYGAGIRRAELAGLRRRHLVARDKGGGLISVTGKGDRTRVIVVSAGCWRALEELAGEASADDPVFRGRGGGALSESQVYRIVRAAGRTAGLDRAISPHWLRHAHASHALERGAPVHLVTETLGHASIATTGAYLHARPSDSSGLYLGI